jgi:hypothetical protein
MYQFDPSLSTTQVFRVGTHGVPTSGIHGNNANFAPRETIPLHESTSLQLRSEFFNTSSTRLSSTIQAPPWAPPRSAPSLRPDLPHHPAASLARDPACCEGDLLKRPDALRFALRVQSKSSGGLLQVAWRIHRSFASAAPGFNWLRFRLRRGELHTTSWE